MNYFYIKIANILPIILIILLSSCSSEESTVPIFSVDVAADSFVPEGGSKTIALTSNLSWNASTSGDWLTVSPTKGAGGITITLTAVENNTPATRKGIVTLTPEMGESIKISVSQATRYQFHVDLMELMFPPVRDTLQVSLTSKSSWKVACSEDWLTVNPENGQSSFILSFIASPNKTQNERLAVVTLTPDVGDAIEILVIQKGVLFSTNISEVLLSGNPEEKTILLMSDVSWEAVSDADWLTIDPINGMGLEEAKINLIARRNDTAEDRFTSITLTPEIGDPITISVLQEGSAHIGESIRYVAINAKGNGTGNSKANAADFLSTDFWKEINIELEYKSVEVKFLSGSYLRAFTMGGSQGLVLESIGNEKNQLIITGGEEVIFPVLEGYKTKSNLVYLKGCQNVLIRDFNFTGNGFIQYALVIRSLPGFPTSKNIIIDNCTWRDMLGVVYGATGCHFEGTSDITYKNCTFERIGIDSHSHMMYHANFANKINIIDCHFEDCTGDYVRFRNQCDYGVVKNCVFIRNNNYPDIPFIGIPVFNNVDPGDEYIASNYSFTDNTFINKASTNILNAIYFGHFGFSPKGYNYLLTTSEGYTLKYGSSSERIDLIKNNFNIDVNKIRITNNRYTTLLTNQVALISKASYGSEGWGGTANITELVNKSDKPFAWEK